MTEFQNGLPPGWHSKYDENSGRYYYIHHYSKTTTWEDPRTKQREVQGALRHSPNVSAEYAPMQAHILHRSPEIRRNSVYPNHPPPIEAFLANSVPSQEIKIVTRSPLKLRSAKVQDVFLATSNSSTALDESVAKIGAMFPTVSETHIRLLLNKYLHREALVISALQVEKHPITTPGPFSTPPPQRNIYINIKDTLSRAGSPYIGSRIGTQGFRSAGNLHSSPKLKLRYMKSIFPHADETIILECLQNNDNSIQMTSEKLSEMGYSKKEKMKPATPTSKSKTEEKKEVSVEKTKTPNLPVKTKTMEDKEKIKQNLRDKYADVQEHLIAMALESVNFDERRANEILKIMKEEDTEIMQIRKNYKEKSASELDGAPPSSNIKCQIPVTQSRQSIKSLLKCEPKKENPNRYSRVIGQDNQDDYKSDKLCNTLGHNNALSKGPNQRLLLENYVQWQGSNKAISKGPQGLSKGSNTALLSRKMYKTCGPNADLRKGATCGLAKGSLFNQMKALIVGESKTN
ncbi:uncharacterized protein [Euwallacea fornicatus]|uniref:uncharacterized protein isoform X1 n=1 Tax=Euwallacea fornicatus TaxID=995702 RepID=UPI00338EAB48